MSFFHEIKRDGITSLHGTHVIHTVWEVDGIPKEANMECFVNIFLFSLLQHRWISIKGFQVFVTSVKILQIQEK